MPEVLCVGNAVADTIARPLAALPPRGQLRLIASIGLHPGGCALTPSIALARLGVSASVATAVGDDGFGDFLVARLKAEGVDVTGVVRTRDRQTSATVVAVGADGERSFSHVTGASAGLTERCVPDALLRRHQVMHLGGYFLLPGLDGTGAARLFARAKRLGLTTTLDTAWDARGRWHLVRPVLPHVDWFLPSIEEAARIFGVTSPERIARAALAAGVRRGVVLGRGAKGCWALVRDGHGFSVPACRVRVVDATGAGDCFDAGFIAGLRKGLPPSAACRLANAAGALCVAGVGGQGRIQSWAQARRLAGL